MNVTATLNAPSDEYKRAPEAPKPANSSAPYIPATRTPFVSAADVVRHNPALASRVLTHVQQRGVSVPDSFIHIAVEDMAHLSPDDVVTLHSIKQQIETDAAKELRSADKKRVWAERRARWVKNLKSLIYFPFDFLFDPKVAIVADTAAVAYLCTSVVPPHDIGGTIFFGVIFAAAHLILAAQLPARSRSNNG